MKKILIIGLLPLLAASFFSFSADKVFADQHTLLIKEDGVVQESLESLSQRAEELNRQIQELREDKTELEMELKENETMLEAKRAKHLETKKAIEQLIADIEKQQKEYKKVVLHSYQREKILKKKLVAIQDQSRSQRLLPVLLESKNIDDLLGRITAIIKIVEADNELLQSTIDEQKIIEEKQFQLEGSLIKLETLKMDLILEMNEIENKNDEQQALLIQIEQAQENLIQEKNSLNEKIETKRANLIKQLARSTIQSASMNYENGVPLEYVTYYKSASEKYGIDWYVLAAIHSVETAYSTHPTMISSVGAEGPYQFMSCSWLGWSYAGCKGTKGGVNIPDHIKTNPASIKQYGGYGIDADGDGTADPFNLADAVESAASYLAKNGYATNPAKAIYQYNHAGWYVEKVLLEAKKIKSLNS